jgi:[ribosomal protein S18]-alanine N-acetyltransferase
MEQSEPWITLGRGYQAGMAMLRDDARERHLALLGEQPAGFAVLLMQGALTGYLQTICVAPGFRARGIGAALMDFAEARVFARHANFFLTVSDFNVDARRFYERRGYHVVGELKDYVIAGRSEILMRKTRGPIRGYTA